MDPESPMNTRAGEKLWGRKPRQPPIVTQATSAPGWAASRPWSVASW